MASDLLNGWGRILLLGAFGAALIQAMRGEKDLTECFERLALAVVFLTFYLSWADGLNGISVALSKQIRSFSEQDQLKALILNKLSEASQTPYANGDTGFNIPSFVEQVWRTGVWGVMNSIVEFIFLLVDLLIECAREALWKLSLVLFPLACGVYPVLPRIMTNLTLYLVELSLWSPILCIVRATTGAVAIGYLGKTDSVGLYIIGVEIVAIVLILAVPAVTHRLMSGALAGDFNTQASVIGIGRKVLTAAKGGLLR